MLSAAKTIMVVDQDDISMYVTQQMLRFAGFTGKITPLKNVDHAIELLHESLPDLLIIDFNQNEKDKFRLLKEIERFDEIKEPSIVVLCDYNEQYVRQLSALFPITSYHKRPPLELEEVNCL